MHLHFSFVCIYSFMYIIMCLNLYLSTRRHNKVLWSLLLCLNVSGLINGNIFTWTLVLNLHMRPWIIIFIWTCLLYKAVFHKLFHSKTYRLKELATSWARTSKSTAINIKIFSWRKKLEYNKPVNINRNIHVNHNHYGYGCVII